MEQMTRVTCLNLPSRLLKAPPLWWRRKPRRLDLPYRRQRDLEVLLLWLVSLRVRLRCILIRCILVFRSTTLMQLQQFEVKLPERVWRDIRVRTLYMKLSYRHDNTAKPIESAQSPSARYGIWKFRLPLYWVWSKNTRAGKEGMVDSKSTDSNAYTTSSESHHRRIILVLAFLRGGKVSFDLRTSHDHFFVSPQLYFWARFLHVFSLYFIFGCFMWATLLLLSTT